jgi:hypothetical protein
MVSAMVLLACRPILGHQAALTMTTTPAPTTTLPVVTTVEVTAYFDAGLRADRWAAVTNKDGAVTDSTVWLDTLCWDLEADCCGRTLEDAYLQAVSELALALATSPDALAPGAPGDGRMTTKEKLGDLELQYAPIAQHNPGYSRENWLAQRYPWLKQIIGCWASFGGITQVRLYRN